MTAPACHLRTPRGLPRAGRSCLAAAAVVPCAKPHSFRVFLSARGSPSLPHPFSTSQRVYRCWRAEQRPILSRRACWVPVIIGTGRGSSTLPYNPPTKELSWALDDFRAQWVAWVHRRRVLLTHPAITPLCPKWRALVDRKLCRACGILGWLCLVARRQECRTGRASQGPLNRVRRAGWGSASASALARSCRVAVAD